MSEENVTQMRETIERLSKDKAGLTSQVESLTKEVRVRDAREAFRTEGYNPKHGDLWAAVNPEGDPTAEAVVAFSDEQGFTATSTNDETPAEGDASTDEGAAAAAALSKMSGGGSRGGDGGASGAVAQPMSRSEWKRLHATDPAAARAAIASGRVEITKDNIYLGNKQVDNPYAPVAAE